MKRDKLLNDCPEFDDFNHEEILAWASENLEARVEWSDEAVGPKGRVKGPQYALWSLIWKPGVIGFDHLPKLEDEEKARKTAALFIYLWCKGIEASIASRLADSYVRSYTITLL